MEEKNCVALIVLALILAVVFPLGRRLGYVLVVLHGCIGRELLKRRRLKLIW
jgi:hypothetical protein